MRIAVLGPTGFGGSHVSLELITRGHHVVGISRNPAKLGKHAHYEPRQLNIDTSSTAQLISAFHDVEIVINAYNPPHSPDIYRTFVETARKIVTAIMSCPHLTYFLAIGGTASLPLGPPHPFYATAADSRAFWLAYRRATPDSETATYHMEESLGLGTPAAQSLRAYRTARLALRSGKATADDRKTIEQTEKPVLESQDFAPEIPLAARATYLFFDGNTTFPWTFVSPPARYVPGPRTGRYEVVIDRLPLAPDTPQQQQQERNNESSEDENEFDGRLLGISAADLAVAKWKTERKWASTGAQWRNW